MNLGNGASQTKVEPLGKLSRMLRVSMATNRRQPLGAVTLKKQWKLITYHVIDMPRGMGRLGVKNSKNCPELKQETMENDDIQSWAVNMQLQWIQHPVTPHTNPGENCCPAFD